MANPHFNNFLWDNDAQIIEDLTSDFIYDHGIGVQYMPRVDAHFDPVMQEPTVSTFRDAFGVDIFIEASTGQYMGPNAMFDFAGFSYGKDNVTIHFDKRKFIEILDKYPTEGDLIYVRELDRIFEIIDVDTPDPMLSGGRHFSIPATMRVYGAGEGTTNFDPLLIDDLDSNNLNEILKALDPSMDLVDPTEQEINDAQVNNDPQTQNERLKDAEPGTPSVDPKSNPFGFS